jgi:multiple sugar transport system permease protein
MGHGNLDSRVPQRLRELMLTTDAPSAGKTMIQARAGYHCQIVRRQRITFFLLVSPALLWFLAFMLWPLLNMFYISTTHWDGLSLPQTFVFLDNYIRLLGDKNIVIGLRNTAIHLVAGVAGVVPFAFMLGFFLSLRKPGHRLLRTIFFSPSMISVAALAMIFLGVYRPDGMLNSFLNSVGLSSLARIWLANQSTALGALIAIDIWSGIGFYSVLFFAALSGIPEELYEAARLDGGDYWTIMWQIAFPLMLDIVGVVVILQFLYILSGAAQNVILLTGGGPGSATLTLGFYLYSEAFLTQRLGYSQAIAVMVFFIGIVVILLIRRLSSRLSY